MMAKKAVFGNKRVYCPLIPATNYQTSSCSYSNLKQNPKYVEYPNASYQFKPNIFYFDCLKYQLYFLTILYDYSVTQFVHQGSIIILLNYSLCFLICFDSILLLLMYSIFSLFIICVHVTTILAIFFASLLVSPTIPIISMSSCFSSPVTLTICSIAPTVIIKTVGSFIAHQSSKPDSPMSVQGIFIGLATIRSVIEGKVHLDFGFFSFAPDLNIGYNLVSSQYLINYQVIASIDNLLYNLKERLTQNISIKLIIDLMRSNFQSTSPQNKISVRLVGIQGSNDFPFNKRQQNGQLYNPITHYPPIHIETETQMSVSAQPVNSRVTTQKSRRRKIFQKGKQREGGISVDRSRQEASRMSSQSPNNLKDHSKEYERKGTVNQQFLNYYTVKSSQKQNPMRIKQKQLNQNKSHQDEDKIKRNSPPSYYLNNSSLSSNRGSYNELSYGSNYVQKNNVNKKNTQQYLHAYSSNSNYPDVQNNQRLPSFARVNSHSDSHSELQRNNYVEMDSVLSMIPEQVKKLRNQMLQQRKQISQLSDKIQKKTTISYKRQKQLLGNLVEKQQQLSRKQRELNQSLQKMSKVQAQSSHRYEQLLKYELELQRAKRVELLSLQNEKLYQELLRNQTRDTADIVPQANLSNIQIKQNFDFQQMSAYNASKLLRDDGHWRQISGLEGKYQGSAFGQLSDYDNNNTIRQLLSPLQIKPDYSF